MFNLFRHQAIPLHRVIAQAAARNPRVGIFLDQPLAIAPELGCELTYASFARLVLEASGWLRAAGVRAGDTVAIVKTNHLDVLVLGCAAARLGAVAALILPDLEPQRCEALLGRLERPLVIADQAALRGAPVPPAARVPLNRPVLMTHTSGTTGVPKLAMHSTASLHGHLRPQITLGRLLGIKGPIGGYVAYTHVRGFTGLLAGMQLGAAMAAPSSPEPEVVRDLFQRVRPTYIETYPNVYLRWEELGRAPDGPLANVQYFFSTFDALHPRSIRNMLAASHRRLPLFIQIYGQSELGPVTMRVSTRATARHMDGRCIGFPIPGFTRVRLAEAATGAPITSAGRTGRIQVRTDARCLTYQGEAERAASSTFGSWWYTGDLGERSRFGCLHLLDREVEHDPRLGSALRIEDTLLDRLEGLTEAVVVVMPDGPAVPVVATRGDVPLDSVAWRYATRGLPSLADPVQLRWADIPRTPTTKVRRGELRNRLLAGELSPIHASI